MNDLSFHKLTCGTCAILSAIVVSPSLRNRRVQLQTQHISMPQLEVVVAARDIHSAKVAADAASLSYGPATGSAGAYHQTPRQSSGAFRQKPVRRQRAVGRDKRLWLENFGVMPLLMPAGMRASRCGPTKSPTSQSLCSRLPASTSLARLRRGPGDHPSRGYSSRTSGARSRQESDTSRMSRRW